MLSCPSYWHTGSSNQLHPLHPRRHYGDGQLGPRGGRAPRPRITVSQTWPDRLLWVELRSCSFLEQALKYIFDFRDTDNLSHSGLLRLWLLTDTVHYNTLFMKIGLLIISWSLLTRLLTLHLIQDNIFIFPTEPHNKTNFQVFYFCDCSIFWSCCLVVGDRAAAAVDVVVAGPHHVDLCCWCTAAARYWAGSCMTPSCSSAAAPDSAAAASHAPKIFLKVSKYFYIDKKILLLVSAPSPLPPPDASAAAPRPRNLRLMVRADSKSFITFSPNFLWWRMDIDKMHSWNVLETKCNTFILSRSQNN